MTIILLAIWNTVLGIAIGFTWWKLRAENRGLRKALGDTLVEVEHFIVKDRELNHLRDLLNRNQHHPYASDLAAKAEREHREHLAAITAANRYLDILEGMPFGQNNKE